MGPHKMARNYFKFWLTSGQIGGSPVTSFDQVQSAAISTEGSYDPGTSLFSPRRVFVAIDKFNVQTLLTFAYGSVSVGSTPETFLPIPQFFFDVSPRSSLGDGWQAAFNTPVGQRDDL